MFQKRINAQYVKELTQNKIMTKTYLQCQKEKNRSKLIFLEALMWKQNTKWMLVDYEEKRMAKKTTCKMYHRAVSIYSPFVSKLINILKQYLCRIFMLQMVFVALLVSKMWHLKHDGKLNFFSHKHNISRFISSFRKEHNPLTA